MKSTRHSIDDFFLKYLKSFNLKWHIRSIHHRTRDHFTDLHGRKGENKMKNTSILLIMTSVMFALALSVVGALISSGCESGNADEIKGSEEALLSTAPNVPPPITRDYPTKVIVHLFAKERVGRLADGVQYDFWTFNGTVPGPMIRVRQGDIVEIHLSNSPGNMMPHSIDLHAVIGPGGGASSSETFPGHTTVFSFKARHAGLFVYHCATPPVPIHIANGMYGMILVQPKDGFPPVDKEFCIMQSEFYTTGNYGDPGLQQFDLQKAIDEDPTYVVFNGSVGALMGENALKVDEGQEVRLYVGNIGPNLTSSFHVIGEQFANVYMEGGSKVTAHDIQTTLIPAGGAAIVEFTAEVPGTYMIVDHSIFRAFYKGAMGQIVVSGPPNTEVFQGKTSDEPYLGEQSFMQGLPYGIQKSGQNDRSASAAVKR